jgi:hypothetical protein
VNRQRRDTWKERQRERDRGEHAREDREEGEGERGGEEGVLGVWGLGIGVLEGINNLESNRALLSTFYNSVNLLLLSFLVVCNFQYHCFNIFIGL